ncbi:MAG: uracil-DNA glycosylase family protein [Nanoarchaeota archaeon]
MNNPKTFAEKAFNFYTQLELPGILPKGITAMNPYQDLKARKYSKLFLDKFFSDNQARIFVFGINPGRFGAGLTGVTFTDPVALKEFCGISNDFPPRRELSSDFVYKFIEQWGGAERFYQDFFLTAVCPLGFTKEGNNYNFYDDRQLLAHLKPFLLQNLASQISLGASLEAAIILGSGKNYQIFGELNKERRFFKKIYPLEHPRFILQYRRSKINAYLKKYHQVFSEIRRQLGNSPNRRR